MLIPRLLLSLKGPDGLIPEGLQQSLNDFIDGQWLLLLRDSQESDEKASHAARRKRRHHASDDWECRAESPCTS